MTLIDGVLDTFVTVDTYTIGACNLTRYSANTTPCGDEIVTSLANMLLSVADPGNQLFGSLAAT